MKKKEAERKFWTRVASAVFFIVALAHLSRLIFQFDLVIGDWLVPLFYNLAAVVLAGFLSVKLYNFTCGK